MSGLEPEIDDLDIQGNVLLGFNKPCQAIVPLFFDASDAPSVKRWLEGSSARVTSTHQIINFRDKRRRAKEAGEKLDPEATPIWLNLSFGFGGLAKLTPDADQFRDPVFRDGLAAASHRLGDPLDTAPGAPSTWLFGGLGNEPDGLAVIAGDSIARVEERLAEFVADAAAHGVVEKGTEIGKDLGIIGGGAQTEHFGFKDGVSQPAVRGTWRSFSQRHVARRMLPTPTDFVPVAFAEPGKPLICAGEFVLGYSRQSDGFGGLEAPPYRLGNVGGARAPGWASNGSFLVYRRLRQDVQAFRSFIASSSDALRRAGENPMSDDLLGALIVGRWKNGAPIISYPDFDPGIVSDGQDFGFIEDTNARRCPASAHIRKVNPRDLTTEQGGPVRTLTHRMLRRGIPFGPIFSADSPSLESTDRGLLFLAYQANIKAQFEFVTSSWANATRRPHTPDSDWGHDMIIGRGSRSEGGRRFFVFDRGIRRRIDTANANVMDWVTPTGGGYFFTPSISAIREVLSA